MFIDSHCHLDRVDLKPYHHSFAEFMREASAQQISQMLCIAIDLEAYPNMLALVESYPQIAVSVGVHPNERDGKEPDVAELVALAHHPKVIAIGETGLDYFRTVKSEQDAQEVDWEWQQQRFRNHIKAAKLTHKPLIIHTREARLDTLRILQEEGAEQVGGIIHCFTEDWAFAEAAMALNFYISFSGIVTFNNATAIKDVAKRISADRFLIETDSPYLAPVPKRGKPNYPMYVRYVAEYIAQLRNASVDAIAACTAENYCRLFNLPLIPQAVVNQASVELCE